MTVTPVRGRDRSDILGLDSGHILPLKSRLWSVTGFWAVLNRQSGQPDCSAEVFLGWRPRTPPFSVPRMDKLWAGHGQVRLESGESGVAK